MDKRGLLYPTHNARIVGLKKKVRESKEIHETSKKNIIEFMEHLEAIGTGMHQQNSYFDKLIPLAKFLKKSFKNATKKDMVAYFAAYRKNGGLNGNAVSPETINKTISCIKCFYRWIYNLASEDKAPEQVRWLKKEPTPNKLRAEDLWTEKDMEKIMKVTRSLRDKCIFSVLYETGLRPGELRALKIKDIKINGEMIRLYVAGKTERKTGERLIPILRSYNLLRMWISQHPRKDDTEAWLWTFNDKPLKEDTLGFMFRNMSKMAGVAKPSNPYILRHTALTRFYRELSGTVAGKLAGHSPGSKEAQRYCHLSAEDLENAIRKMNGIEEKENQEVTKCHKCNQTLGVGDRLCPVCGLVQDNDLALEKAEEEKKATDFMYGLKVLSKQNPDLNELKEKMEEFVNKMLRTEKK